MFERSLSSLIKGLRSHRGKDEAKYIATVLDEIRHEVRSGDMEVKAEAVLKLTYLQMLGHPAAHASFHMLEIMASPRYHLKHIGYLAAAQCFTQDTDVLILATNMIKKDLHSASPLDIAVALNGLSHIVTPDLARHLAPDIIAMLTHSRPAIRKKAVLVLYAVIAKHPEALDHAWTRLREKLEDSDLGVVSATVNIICELARRDPRPFLPLAPQLFHLLTNSTNNWMLIKVIKLFGALTPHEPRLVKKLLPPITSIISTTPAMSLLYECIHTVIIGGMLVGAGGDDLARTCVEKLARFLEDADQNLKYISLLALVKILPTHPHLVAEHQDIIFQSIDDPDLSIRMRALELVSGMASRRNFQTIVSQLLSHLEPSAALETSSAAAALKLNLSSASSSITAGAAAAAASTLASPTSSATYRLEIVRRILSLCSADTYANVTNFEWYLGVLVKLAYTAKVDVGARLRDQIIDVTARVRAVRGYAVKCMSDVLADESFVLNDTNDAAEVLHAAAWVCGEYREEVADPPAVILLLLRPAISELPASTVTACVHNGVKLFAHWAIQLATQWDDAQVDEVRRIAANVTDSLDHFAKHADGEVQERAVEFRQLFTLLNRDVDSYKKVASKTAPVTAPAAAGADEGVPALQIDDGFANSSWSSWQNGNGHERPPAPKSLHLLSPLFFGHALGPVAERAQSKVPVPLGLDLDAWIVPPGTWDEVGSVRLVEDTSDLDTSERKVTNRKGKGKEKEKEKEGAGRVSLVSTSADSEDPEEVARRKAERRQRLKDDPFYIMDAKSSKPSKSKTSSRNPSGTGTPAQREDVDSIPIVQLYPDDLPSLSGTGTPPPAAAEGGSPASNPPPPVVLHEGEMPEQLVKPKKISKRSASGASGKKKKAATAAVVD